MMEMNNNNNKSCDDPPPQEELDKGNKTRQRLVPKPPKLDDPTPKQMEVYDELVEIINSPNVDQLYNDIPDSFGGKVIGTDLSRELSPYYRGSREGAILYSLVTSSPASTYAQDRFQREIQKEAEATPNDNDKDDNNKKKRTVLFTAGGPASGKTFVIGPEVIKSVQLCMDQNLGKYERSVEQITVALDHGWQVKVVYVYRPFDLVPERVIDRANDIGRWSPLAVVVDAHLSAQASVLKLYDKFQQNPDVSFVFYSNCGSKDNPAPPTEITIEDIMGPNGQYHLASEDNVARMREQMDQAIDKAKGVVEPRLYQAMVEGKNPAALVTATATATVV